MLALIREAGNELIRTGPFDAALCPHTSLDDPDPDQEYSRRNELMTTIWMAARPESQPETGVSRIQPVVPAIQLRLVLLNQRVGRTISLDRLTTGSRPKNCQRNPRRPPWTDCYNKRDIKRAMNQELLRG